MSGWLHKDSSKMQNFMLYSHHNNLRVLISACHTRNTSVSLLRQLPDAVTDALPLDFPPLGVSAVMLSKVVMSPSRTCCVRTCSCQTSTLAIEIVHDLNRRHHCHVCNKSAETFTFALCRHVCVPLDGGASHTLQGSPTFPAEIR